MLLRELAAWTRSGQFSHSASGNEGAESANTHPKQRIVRHTARRLRSRNERDDVTQGEGEPFAAAAPAAARAKHSCVRRSRARLFGTVLARACGVQRERLLFSVLVSHSCRGKLQLSLLVARVNKQRLIFDGHKKTHVHTTANGLIERPPMSISCSTHKLIGGVYQVSAIKSAMKQ